MLPLYLSVTNTTSLASTSYYPLTQYHTIPAGLLQLSSCVEEGGGGSKVPTCSQESKVGYGLEQGYI